MHLVIFEDSIKDDLWIKVVLVSSVVLLIGLGILFDVDARNSDIFSGEAAAESRTGSFVLFAAAAGFLARIGSSGAVFAFFIGIDFAERPGYSSTMDWGAISMPGGKIQLDWKKQILLNRIKKPFDRFESINS